MYVGLPSVFATIFRVLSDLSLGLSQPLRPLNFRGGICIVSGQVAV